jgi:hypothetical protein
MKLIYLLGAMALALSSGTASAISAQCVSATQFGIPQCALNPATQAACVASIQANHPECFGTSSSTAASTQAISSTSFQQMQAVSRVISTRMSAGKARTQVSDSAQSFGLAGGDTAAQWNFWGSVNRDKNTYDRGSYVDAAAATRNNKYNAAVTNLTIGGDYQISPTLVVGLSAASDNSSGNGESFLNGGSLGIATQNSSGYTVAPYLGWQIDQDWSLDATLGMGSVKTDTDGIKGKADRLFYGANVNYVTYTGGWQLTGKGSYLHGQEKSGDMTNAIGGVMAGTAANNKVDQLRLEGQAGYWLNDNAMPYFGLGYSNDINRSTTVAAAAQLGKELGKNAFLWTLGVNFFSIQNSVTGGISYNQETGRSYAKNNSLMGNVNVRF